MEANCFLISQKKCSDTLIIDPGDDGDYICQQIEKNSLKPLAIFLTHGHFDHVLASADLQLIYNLPIFLNNNDVFLYERAISTAKYFTKIKDYLPSFRTLNFSNNKAQELRRAFSFRIINTPGHTPGSSSFYFPKMKLLLCGDLIFSDGNLGTYSHKYSDKKEMLKSIRTILKLPDETLLFPGHGPKGLLKNIKILKKYK
jgi:glyoxylase-like metal-dependent hydrolase (beta-lactamase superfamily II)